VRLTSPLPEAGLTALQGFEVTVGPPTADTEAIVCLLTDRIGSEVLHRGSPLRVVSTVSVGYDNVDVAAATAAGVLVTNTPGVLDEATADLAFALVLAACRRLSDAEAALRRGEWDGWRLDGFLGVDPHGAVLGLVGYGRIGRAVARRAAGFGMDVRHHTRHNTGVPGWTGDLDGMLRACDVVSVHVPLTPGTTHLIDARRLALLRPTAVLVNTARGQVVDADALADALEGGRLFAAGLDVYAEEPRVSARLISAPHLTLLPHIGSATEQTRLAMIRYACADAAAVLRGQPPKSPINPEVLH
jgi:glyoxylate reductase